MTLFFRGEVCILERERERERRKEGLRVIFPSRLNTRAFSKINICGWSSWWQRESRKYITEGGKSWKRIELFIWLNVYAGRIIFFSPLLVWIDLRVIGVTLLSKGLFTRLRLITGQQILCRLFLCTHLSADRLLI